jgi:TatD DNase family protein
MPRIIDTHAHLDLEHFDPDRSDVVKTAIEAGVDRIIIPAVDADSSRNIVDLVQNSPNLFAAVGMQPNHCSEAKPGDWERIEELAGSPRVVGIGETGLDRYWDYTPIEMQRDYFQRHLVLSRRLQLPIIIHCREAHDDLMPILQASFEQDGPILGLIHSFSGDVSMLKQYVDVGLFISFAGAVTYRNKKFTPLWEAAVETPAERLLVETDAPYLTPHPLRGKVKRNEPKNVALTIERIAELRGQTPDEIAELTTKNAECLFGI